MVMKESTRRKGIGSTVLIACHRSSLLILDCMSSITPSIGETSRLGEDSDAVQLPCLFHPPQQFTVNSGYAEALQRY